ncbi:pentapeptide repeat-containing protein [Anabaena sp. CCY 9910]|uniref:pentapeptide repeat-containing protein n=1 Tax=Anabaena sp. CCY 9910 TaxID=3103870 RepID=UPI0039E1C016
MANEEHLAILRQGVEVWNEWRQKNSGVKTDLSNINIHVIDDLKVCSDGKINLEKANFRNTNLSKANLSAVELHSAEFEDAIMQSITLSNARLPCAALMKADLRNSDLRNANLINANLEGANLKSANLEGANLRGANLKSANLEGANLENANLAGTKLIDTNCKNANFTGCKLKKYATYESRTTENAYFLRTNLCGANLISISREIPLRSVLIDSSTKIEDKYYIVWNILNNPKYSRILSGVDISRTSLGGANLEAADLSSANLEGTDLSSANLRGANLRDANLRDANLRDANLCGADLSNADFLKAQLSFANFRESKVNFRLRHIEFDPLGRKEKVTRLEVKWQIVWEILNNPNYSRNLVGENLNDADLSNADLRGANLKEVSFISTKLDRANLTGACIEDWNINSSTTLNDVICDYIYLRQGQQERRPSSGNFAPGEFTKLFQKSLETVDLIFRNGIDWDAFAYSFKKLEVENQGAQLDVQSIEKKGDGVLLVRVAVAPDADKVKIHSDFMQGYEFAAKVLEAQYQARLEDKEKVINQLFSTINQQNQLLAQTGDKVSIYYQPNSQFAGGIVDAINVDAQQIGGNIQNNNTEDFPN